MMAWRCYLVLLGTCLARQLLATQIILLDPGVMTPSLLGSLQSYIGHTRNTSSKLEFILLPTNASQKSQRCEEDFNQELGLGLAKLLLGDSTKTLLTFEEKPIVYVMQCNSVAPLALSLGEGASITNNHRSVAHLNYFAELNVPVIKR